VESNYTIRGATPWPARPGSHLPLTSGQKVFRVFNAIALAALALACLLPFWYVICVSFSDASAVLAGRVRLLPVNFSLASYQYVLERGAFWTSLLNTFKRVGLGVPLNVLLVILSAYPLSKEGKAFSGRTVYVWIFFITMLFNGGLIPNYLLIIKLKLLNSIWALVLPGCLNVFNVVLMLNFFRQIPPELEDAAFVDGAGHWRILWRIWAPISVPSIATITLFSLVTHWNSWFDGMIYMKKMEYQPLQTYLRSIIMTMNFETMSVTELERLSKLNDRAVKCSQIIIGAIPIIMVYPFLQRYFVTGITLGSVKG
jgi:putative aldouronate transport system permease protein